MADPTAVEPAVEPRPPQSFGESLQLQLFSYLQVTHPGICVFPPPQLCLPFPLRPRAGARLPVGKLGPAVASCRTVGVLGLGSGIPLVGRPEPRVS